MNPKPIVCAVLVGAPIFAGCGGESVSRSDDDERGGTSAGTGGSGGTSGNPSCPGPASAPEITLTPNCSDFAPSLSTATIDFVGVEAVEGRPELVGHRFDAPAGLANGCGYELVVALPGLTFAGSGTYNLNAWWTYANRLPRLMAAVLRRDGETLPEFGVAEADAGSLASALSAPLAIGAVGRACDGCWSEPGMAGSEMTLLSHESEPIACNMVPSDPRLFRCDGLGRDWHVLVYCVVENAEYPVVYGRSDRLTR